MGIIDTVFKGCLKIFLRKAFLGSPVASSKKEA
jgi:hypothetical protein